MENTIALLLSAFALCLGVALRLIFSRSRRTGAVDHHYWVRVASEFKKSRGLPVDLDGKYLLEDSRQFYPPGFAVFLSMFSLRFLRSSKSILIPQFVDIALAIQVAVFMVIWGCSPEISLLSAALLLCSPTLGAYNFQVTSRCLGNFFASSTLLLQFTAQEVSSFLAPWIWLASTVAAGLTVLTHKMSTQLLFTVELVAAATAAEAMERVGFLLVPLGAVGVAVLVTGPSFQVQQWRAHVDIVSFWNRNWRLLGAHQILNSPIYGDENTVLPGRYHGKGIRASLTKIFRILVHLPAALPTLVLSLVVDSNLDLIVIWLAVGLSAAFLTSFVGFLKCLGAGHLYMFGVVAPTSILSAKLLATSPAIGGFLCALAISSAIAIMCAQWKRGRIRYGGDNRVAPLIEYLRRHEGTRVAVLPCTAAEEVAGTLDVKVLWGGHSLGFKSLEPFWPVMKIRVGELISEYKIDILVWDKSWLGEAGSNWEQEVESVSAGIRSVEQWEIRHLISQ